MNTRYIEVNGVIQMTGADCIKAALGIIGSLTAFKEKKVLLIDKEDTPNISAWVLQEKVKTKDIAKGKKYLSISGYTVIWQPEKDSYNAKEYDDIIIIGIKEGK